MTTIFSGDTGASAVGVNSVGNTAIQAGAVTPDKTQVGALPSMVRLNTANGYGSTNTVIRRFTNTAVSQGSDITYADSATLGATFTINTSGVYAVSYNDQFNTNAYMGLSLNSTQLTTSILNVNASDVLASLFTANVNIGGTVCCTAYFAAGSVIRAHCGGTSTGANPSLCQFTIVRVA